jgi:type I restriction-modification system DNA methylase subunit
MSTPAAVVELVERFERNIEAYNSELYNEARLRQEFIDPLFKCLGWDVDNSSGAAEAYKDVIHEDSIRVSGSIKAPDYCFRIGGARKFFVEAKKPSVNIKRSADAAFQLRRYAWSSKLPLSILTNFKEISVYDCRLRPDQRDLSSKGRIHYFQFHEYVPRWGEIAGVFSKESVLKGLFDSHVEIARGKRGTAEVDSAFLAEIESWREHLARNIAARNSDLSQRDLNFAVQQTIDRIIFLRICEDRGIERYGRLRELMSHDEVYLQLCVFFKEADEKYNSGLFHFYQDQTRSEEPDRLTLGLRIDDKVLKGIIKDLYYPDSPYEFSVLPADILGQVYEQFLGKVIRLTPSHQARIEDKPEVKKAGGVYYTPTYIVNYIVAQTLGPLLNARTVREASKLKIVDPACGSGSFLLGAYQYLLEWHRQYYEKDGPEKHKKVLYQGAGGGWRLTASERRRILVNNIFGVDIDDQAVEVTKLSLLLNVLEGETEQTLRAQLKMFHERALPDLENNIKSGNSLVRQEFFRFHKTNFFQDEEAARVNAFDWNTEFASIMKSGGFDVIIGNPPWGAEFTADELEYLRSAYAQVVARMVDSYIYFLFRATQLARKGYPVGFIIPSTILNQVDAQPLRASLLERGLTCVINLGQGIFGKKALNTSTILITATQQRDLVLGDLSSQPLSERQSKLPDVANTANVYHPGNMTESRLSYGILSPHIV